MGVSDRLRKLVFPEDSSLPYVCSDCGEEFDVIFHVCPECGCFDIQRKNQE